MIRSLSLNVFGFEGVAISRDVSGFLALIAGLIIPRRVSALRIC